MNSEQPIPIPRAYLFEEIKKKTFAGNYYNSDRFENDAETVNNYLKTLAEIDAEILSANQQAGSMHTTNTMGPALHDELMRKNNNAIVSPDTLYHGFMEENY